jgi:hypothetical protein
MHSIFQTAHRVSRYYVFEMPAFASTFFPTFFFPSIPDGYHEKIKIIKNRVRSLSLCTGKLLAAGFTGIGPVLVSASCGPLLCW